MKRIQLILLCAMATGCISIPTTEPTATASPPYRITADENPFAPKIEDVGWQVATVTLTSISLMERYEFSPPRAAISLVGYMPSVCNELRVNIDPPTEDYRIDVEVYSLVNPDVQCDKVFQQFETTIMLGTYSPGRYTIWVNGGQMGDFVSY